MSTPNGALTRPGDICSRNISAAAISNTIAPWSRSNNMRLAQADLAAAKGWYVGPWNSDLPIAIGYANAGIDEPHVHVQITEIYIVARGTSEIRVEQETITLHAGDMIILEPGEAHTFL